MTSTDRAFQVWAGRFIPLVTRALLIQVLDRLDPYPKIANWRLDGLKIPGRMDPDLPLYKLTLQSPNPSLSANVPAH